MIYNRNDSYPGVISFRNLIFPGTADLVSYRLFGLMGVDRVNLIYNLHSNPMFFNLGPPSFR